MNGLEKDTIIIQQQKKIDNLIYVEQLRADQLIEANIKNDRLNDKIEVKNKEIKRLKRVIFIHKVAFVSGIVATIYIFSH